MSSSSRMPTKLQSFILLVAILTLSALLAGYKTEITPLNPNRVVAGGEHCLGLDNDGTVWAWGKNDKGQLGDGSLTNRATLGKVEGLDNVVSVAAGQVHSLALKSDGTVWSWGYNLSGQLGPARSVSLSPEPLQVEGIGRAVSIVATRAHSLALLTNGTVAGWGANSKGQLGIGRLEGVIAIAGGREHSLALLRDGTVWATGDNKFGQLGNGTATSSAQPVQVVDISNIVAIAAGTNHSLALRTDGTVWSWGVVYIETSFGNGKTMTKDVPQPRPQQVATLDQVVEISAGQDFSLARRSDGTVWAWGYDHGRLGVAPGSRHWIEPGQVVGLDQVIEISASEDHSLALRKDGGLFRWGANLIDIDENHRRIPFDPKLAQVTTIHHPATVASSAPAPRPAPQRATRRSTTPEGSAPSDLLIVTAFDRSWGQIFWGAKRLPILAWKAASLSFHSEESTPASNPIQENELELLNELLEALELEKQLPEGDANK